MLWLILAATVCGVVRDATNHDSPNIPAYSPELNRVENLWHYFRSHYWSDRAYADYDDLRCAAMEAWQKVALDPEIIKSVCRAEYTENIIIR